MHCAHRRLPQLNFNLDFQFNVFNEGLHEVCALSLSLNICLLFWPLSLFSNLLSFKMIHFVAIFSLSSTGAPVFRLGRSEFERTRDPTRGLN